MGRLLRRMNLRFPTLFLLFAVLTVLDLLIPDFIPFVDEFGLALITFILGLWGGSSESTAPSRPHHKGRPVVSLSPSSDFLVPGIRMRRVDVRCRTEAGVVRRSVWIPDVPTPVS
jgi:uncharacterized protein DUF6116